MDNQKQRKLSYTTLKVSFDTRERLKKHGTMADTMDSVINKLIDEHERKLSN